MWLLRRSRHSESRPHPLAIATSPRFAAAVEASELVFDEAQRAAIDALSRAVSNGFYLWGPVGRGKSLLSDLYFDNVPTDRKRRIHFHSFFRELQNEIASTRQPVETSIGKTIGSARVVLFDEFHVHDVADAVYLTKTLRFLIKQEVLVLATSNYAAQELLPNPLFHDRFLPAIRLIEANFENVPLGSGADYRRITDDRQHSAFASGHWTVCRAMPEHAGPSGVVLDVNGLEVRAVAIDGDTATFTFAELCEQPIGIREFLELASRFGSIRLIDVPDLAAVEVDPLTRLCNLIDVLYDGDQRFEAEAASVPEAMLEAKESPVDANRALSRLATLRQRAHH